KISADSLAANHLPLKERRKSLQFRRQRIESANGLDDALRIEIASKSGTVLPPRVSPCDRRFRGATEFRRVMKYFRLILLASALVVPAGLRAESPVAPTATEAFPVYAETNRIAEPSKMPTALRNVFSRLGEADTAVIPFVENRRMGIMKKPVELS